jgi:hypothetical protein
MLYLALKIVPVMFCTNCAVPYTPQSASHSLHRISLTARLTIFPESDENEPQLRLEFVGVPTAVAAELTIVFRPVRSVTASARMVGVRRTPVMSMMLEMVPENMLRKR